MFLDFFYSFLKRAPQSNVCISRNITWNFLGCISKSKLAFPQYNKTYLSVIAFIVFILHEIENRKFFLGHPVVYHLIKYHLMLFVTTELKAFLCGVKSPNKQLKAHCLPLDWISKLSSPWWINVSAQIYLHYSALFLWRKGIMKSTCIKSNIRQP
jgi:hypothetical protein